MEATLHEPPLRTNGSVEIGHFAWLDSLRALAALWVVAYHGILTVGFADQGGFSHFVLLLLSRGPLAVTAFIAISGFSLALSPSRNGWRLKGGYKEFITSRWVRIVPVYYASILLSLFLIATLIGQRTGTHWDVSIPVTPKSLVLHLLLVQNFVGVPKINHVYWSVALEFQIYLFFGLVLWGMRWRGIVGTLAVGAALAAFGTGLHFALLPLMRRGIVANDAFTLGTYFLVFTFGVCACRLAADLRAAERSVASFWIIAAASLMLFGLNAVSDLKRDVSFGLGMSLLLLILATNPRLSRSFSFPPLASVGTFAYSLYLTHAPMLQVVYVLGKVWHPQDSSGHAMLYLAVALPICVAFAYVFYLACERPFFKLHHALKRRRASAG